MVSYPELNNTNFKYTHTLKISDYKFIDNQHQLYSDESEYYNFVCFNIVHEIFHCLCKEYAQNDNHALAQFEEEILANKFSVSFWKLFGEKDFLEKIYEFSLKNAKKMLIKYNHNYNQNDDIDYLSYLNDYKSDAKLLDGKLVVSINHFDENYNFFQLCSILDSFSSTLTMNDIFKLIGSNLKLVQTPSYESPIINFIPNKNAPKELLELIIRMLNDYDIYVPDINYKVIYEDGFNSITSTLINIKKSHH